MDAVKGLQGIISVLLVAALILAAGCVTQDDGADNTDESSGDAVAQGDPSTTSSTTLSTTSSTSSTIDAIDEYRRNEELREELNDELQEIIEETGPLSKPEPSEPVATSTTLAPSRPSVEKVEVLHFHGNSQCVTCKKIGEYAEETVNTYFAKELKSGKLYFAHVNYDLPENRELVRKYGVSGSSLWIGVYTDQGFSCMPNQAVWYRVSNKKDFMNYLRGVIAEKLSGE